MSATPVPLLPAQFIAASLDYARASLELADNLDDAALRAAAMGLLAVIRFNAAEPGALLLAEQAYSVASDLGDPEVTAEELPPCVVCKQLHGSYSPCPVLASKLASGLEAN